MKSIIKNRDVVADDWTVVRADEHGNLPSAPPSGRQIVPLALWQRDRDAWPNDEPAPGVWLAPDDDPAELVEDLARLPLIAVDFPVFRDGRGYSIARLLRERHGWRGELRAIGDVLRDQLGYMARCGFDAFEVRADKDIRDALRAFDELSVHYQGAVDDPRPLFRRREAAGARS